MTKAKQAVFGLGNYDKEDEKGGKQNGKGEVHKRLTWRALIFAPGQLRTIAKYCPLIAAIFAPLATLLDIPALTVSMYILACLIS